MTGPTRFRLLSRQLAPGELCLDAETLAAHSGDKWFASHPPDAVALPRTASGPGSMSLQASWRRCPP